MGNTRPRKVISPVIATSERIGTRDRIDTSAVTIATPALGPSLGVPIRSDVAMTGEITLRGRVLPIGGLKEKLLAALRGGIKTVIIPEENRKDLADIPKNVTQGLEIVPVKWIDEVLDIALVRPIVPQPGEVPTPVEAVDEAAEHKSEAVRPH